MANDYFEHNTKLVPGTKARAEDVNARFDGVVTGMEKLPAPHATLKGFSDPVPVGTPTLKEHAVSVEEALGGGVSFGVDTGLANAYVVDLPIAPASYREGLTVSFKAVNGNTGASTIDLNGLGVKTLSRDNGDPLVNGDIAADQLCSFSYDGAKFRSVAPFAGQFAELTAAVQVQVDAAEAHKDAAGASETQTALDAIATAADRVQTGLDATATAADLVATNQDTIDTAADAAATAADATTSTTQAGIATTKAAEANQSYLDTVAIYGDTLAVQAAVDATAADAVATAADRAAVAADLVATNQDTIDTAADRAAVAADLVQTNQDTIDTAADKIAAEAARTGAEAAETNVLGVESAVIAQGDTQVARVIAEGNTQDARVVTEGDTQDARVIAEGDLQVARIGLLPDTTAGTEGQGLELDANLDWVLVDAKESGIAWVTGAVDVTGVADRGNLLDTTAAPKTYTLPLTPTVGDKVGVGDWKGTAATNNLTIARNGENIMGLAEDLILDLDWAVVTLVYTSTGWIILTSTPVN